MTFDTVMQLVQEAGMGYLATVEGDQPRVRGMMPVLLEDGRLLIATFPYTRKVDQIKKNPKVEICFVDRKLSHCRIEGVALFSEDAALKEQMWNRQVMLRQFFAGPEDPSFVLIVLKPVKILVMNVGDRGYTEVKVG